MTQTKAMEKKPVKRRKKAKEFTYRLFTLGLGIDLPLLIIVLTLLAFGLVMLFSASFAKAYYTYGNSYTYILPQARYALFGVVAMIAISYVDYHLFYKFAWVVFLVASALLCLVLVDTFALKEGVAQRWINIGGVSFQPSELGKFAMVVILAYLICKNEHRLKSVKYSVLPCFGVTGIIAGLVLAEKHVSATIIIALLAFVTMFIGGIQYRWFLILGGIGVILVALIVLNTDVFAYALPRLQGWRDPFNPPEGVSTYQTVQSIYAIGSGQLLGVGIGQSTQKHLYLPESQNDFIYPIVCEELGFIGGLAVIILFVALVWRGFVISINAKDKFGMLVGLGMTLTVGIQAAFNICVVTNAFPNTGISLPFFSYGGTALLVTLGEMGVLLAISRNSYTEKI